MLRVILLSTDVSPKSGWGTVTHALCDLLLKREDIALRILLPKDAAYDKGAPFSEYTSYVLPPFVGSFIPRFYRAIPFILPRIDLDKADIIHAIVEFPYAIIARRLAQKAQIPFMVTIHGTYGVMPFKSRLDALLYRPALCDAAYVTAPSRFSAERMLHASGIRRDVEVVRNAVNFERFQEPAESLSVRGKLGISPEANMILGVGGLKWRKGFDLLIKAFALVAASDPTAHLVIVGDGVERSRLATLAEELGVGGQLSMPGVVSEDVLVALYQGCDIYALLPRNEKWNFEGFGIVYLEAGACGKPAVATRSGGVEDAVIDGETGFLVDEGDFEAAAEAMIELLGNQPLRYQMGGAARSYASRHRWAGFADTMVGLYYRAVQKQEASENVKQ